MSSGTLKRNISFLFLFSFLLVFPPSIFPVSFSSDEFSQPPGPSPPPPSSFHHSSSLSPRGKWVGNDLNFNSVFHLENGNRVKGQRYRSGDKNSVETPPPPPPPSLPPSHPPPDQIGRDGNQFVLHDLIDVARMSVRPRMTSLRRHSDIPGTPVGLS